SMLMLHREVVSIIESGCQSGFFHHDVRQESIEVKAWRLMSVSFGTITISYINPSIMQPVSAAELLKNSIRHELGYQPD
ncbi:MAG: hypothetical protein ACK5M5_14385, partial [Limnobaculum xujianqingii]